MSSTSWANVGTTDAQVVLVLLRVVEEPRQAVTGPRRAAGHPGWITVTSSPAATEALVRLERLLGEIGRSGAVSRPRGSSRAQLVTRYAIRGHRLPPTARALPGRVSCGIGHVLGDSAITAPGRPLPWHSDFLLTSCPFRQAALVEHAGAKRGREAIAMSSGQLDGRVTSGDLIAELGRPRPGCGGQRRGLAGPDHLPGFHRPGRARAGRKSSRCRCASWPRGARRSPSTARRTSTDPFHYLVLSSHLHFQGRDPGGLADPAVPVVRAADRASLLVPPGGSSDMLERRTTAFRSRLGEPRPRTARLSCPPSTRNCLGAVLRSCARWDGRRPAGTARCTLQEMVTGAPARAVRPAARDRRGRGGHQPRCRAVLDYVRPTVRALTVATC